MPQDYEVLYIDDEDNTKTATLPGAAGQVINIPPGWLSVSWTNWGNPNSPVNMGPLFFSSQTTLDAAIQKGILP